MIKDLVNMKCIAAFILMSILAFSSNSERNESVSQLLKHAETYYWLGMAEEGDIAAFDRGIEYLDEARNILKNSKLSFEEKKKLIIREKELRSDLEKQIEIAEVTFYGNFPFSRFFGSVIFLASNAMGTYELIEEPEISAVLEGTETIAQEIEKYGLRAVQYNVLFSSLPQNRLLENKSRYIVNKHSMFYVCSDNNESGLLTPEETDSVANNNFSLYLINKICDGISADFFLLVTIREIDKVDNVYFYQVEGRIYRKNSGLPEQTFYTMTFSRDTRDKVTALIVILFILLILTIVFSIIYRKYIIKKPFGIKENLIVPISGFILGHLLPWIIVPTLASFKPEPDNLAIVSFWWPGVLGFSFLIIPILLTSALSVRLPFLKEYLSLKKERGIFSSFIGIGAVSYLTLPILAYYETGAIAVLLFLLISVILITYFAGQYFSGAEQKVAITTAILAIIFSLLLGISLLHGRTDCFILSCVIIITVLLISRVKGSAEPKQGETGNRDTTLIGKSEITKPKDLYDLLSYIQEPPYYKTENNFPKAMEIVKPFLIQDKTAWISITGKPGIGKTATANALITEIQRTSNKSVIKVLTGKCQQISKEQVQGEPFAPFSELLQNHFDINPFSSQGKQLQDINAALDGLFDSIIPFAGIIFPNHESKSTSAFNQKHFFSSIKDAFIQLAHKNPLIIFIDDIQWADKSSNELLNFLVSEIPADSSNKILFILAGRDDPENLFAKDDKIKQVKLEPLTDSEREMLLNEYMGFTLETSQKIVKESGGSKSKGDMYWLFQILDELLRSSAFIEKDQEFELTDLLKTSKKLPIPKEIRDSIFKTIEELPEYRDYIICAACIGVEFESSVLAKSLGVDRLNCLQKLSDLENKTGLIFEMHDLGDSFCFQSSFVLEIIREGFRIIQNNDRDISISNLIREYHGRIGLAYENNGGRNDQYLYSMAHHFSLAGKDYLDKACEYSIKAAKCSISIYQIEKSSEYIKFIRNNLEYLQNADEVILDCLLLECDMEFITGKNRLATAKLCQEYLEINSSLPASTLLYFVRTFYDAIREDRNFILICQKVSLLILERAENLLQQASAYHYAGLCYGYNEESKREEYLRKALMITDNFSEDERECQLIKAQIMNSLAEDLARRNNLQISGEREIKDLFEKSILIKTKYNDKPGIARSYGGLGRFFYFKKRNITSAREYFEKDLQISQDIFDETGQVQMYSLLGSCDLDEEKYSDALGNYELSYQLAESHWDKYFALLGIIKCVHYLNQDEKVRESGNILLNLVKENQIMHSGINELVELIKVSEERQWVSELLKTQDTE